LAEKVRESGRGTILCNFEVTGAKEVNADEVCLTGKEPFQAGPLKQVAAKGVITCGGVVGDKVARKCGASHRLPRLLPFRGRYWQMKPLKRDIVRTNVYPISSGGFVGCHFTPTVPTERMGKETIVGPSGALALARDAYKPQHVDWRQFAEFAKDPRLLSMMAKAPRKVLHEMACDLSKRAFMNDARKLVPSVEGSDVEPSFAGTTGHLVDSASGAPWVRRP